MNFMPWYRRAAVGIAALGFVPLTVSVAPASASQPAEQHCVLDLTTGASACGPTAEQAEQQAMVKPRLVLVAVLYDQVDYEGSTLTIKGNKPCTAAYDPPDYWLVDLGFLGFDNRAESLRTANQCEVQLFDDVDLSGPRSPWIIRSRDLRTVGDGWSNRASSIAIS
ncbi:hypothetical protein [Saccharothrix obliqua]|uniref:hypothetical protein n=1 Tax=Saccharothrix obliqua TaxID=2861747 RepID=UPI001C5CD30C|nr:hypothetical protein [Saccharothrix obliqua]MBW4721394.1 hypothetical protein [Saccharothrix obliqua]